MVTSRAASPPTRRRGGALSVEDLASFRANLREPLAIQARGQGLRDAGTHLRTDSGACLTSAAGRGGPDAKAYTAYALALQSAYRERLQDMGDAEGRRALGAKHLAPACTTHFSVVDRSTFGSKYVLRSNAGYPDAANRRWSSDKKKCPIANGSKHRTRRHLWGGRVLLRRSPPSDRGTWKIPKLRRVVSPAFRGGYLNVVTAPLGELSGLFKS
jgi:hypothetical protein